MVLEYLNFRRVLLIQEILYNKGLTLDELNQTRGALHEIDQIMTLPQTAKKRHEMGQQTGLREVATKTN